MALRAFKEREGCCRGEVQALMAGKVRAVEQRFNQWCHDHPVLGTFIIVTFIQVTHLLFEMWFHLMR